MTWTADQPDRRGVSSTANAITWKSYVDQEAQHINIRFTLLQEELDRRFATERRMLDNAKHEREEATKLLANHTAHNFNLLQEELDRRFATEKRMLEKTEHDRVVSAEILAKAMKGSIDESIERLHEHIVNQGIQINQLVDSVEGRALLRHEGIGREFLLRQAASDAAVQKAEDAQKEVNIRSNEFRGQLKDQNATMMPRSESEKEASALGERIRILEAAYQTQIGLNQANIRNQDRTQPWAIWAVGAGVSLLIALIIIGIGAFT